MEGELETGYEWWQDEDFVAELNKRHNDLESGEVKGIIWEEVRKTLQGV